MRNAAIVGLLALTAIGQPLPAQMARDSIITVSAQRMLTLRPDRASFYVIVSGYGRTASDAIANLDSNLTRTSSVLARLGSSVATERPVTLTVGEAPRSNPYGPEAPRMCHRPLPPGAVVAAATIPFRGLARDLCRLVAGCDRHRARG